MSLRSKMLVLFIGLIAVSLVCVIFVVSNLVSTNGVKNLESDLFRTLSTIETLLYSQEDLIQKQIKLVAELPILQTVIDNGDEQTILDSLNTYQKQLNIDQFFVLDEDSVFLTGSKDSLAISEIFVKNNIKVLEDLTSSDFVTSRVFHNGKIYIVSCSRIGSIDDELGYLSFSQAITSRFTQQVEKFTGAKVSVLSREGKKLAASNSDFKKDTYLASIPLFEDKNSNSVHMGNFLVLPQALFSLKRNTIGWLVIEYSKSETLELITQFTYALLKLSILIFLLASLITVIFSAKITKPIRTLVKLTKKLASGDFEVEIPSMPNDEIGDLAFDFQEMSQAIQKSYSELTDLNHSLESKIEQRTKSIQSLLDNSSQGFLSFNDKFELQGEFSKECNNMLQTNLTKGTDVPKSLFTDVKARDEFRSWMANAFQKTIEMSVIADLSPQKVQINEKLLGLEYKLIENEDHSLVMMILTDLTEIIEMEKLVEREKSQVKMVLRVLSNKRVFLHFCKEIEKQLQRKSAEILNMSHAEIMEFFRTIHTLKGTSGMLEFLELTEDLHHLESVLQEVKDTNEFSEEESLTHSLKIVTESFNSLLQYFHANLEGVIDFDSETVRVPKALVQSILPSMRNSDTYHDWAQLLCRPFHDLFVPYVSLIEELSHRFEKPLKPLKIDGGEFLVNPDYYQNFIDTLVHLFRNSVDHGIERPEYREDINKDYEGELSVSIQWSKIESEPIKIQIRDDGGGINPDIIKKALLNKELKSLDEVAAMTSEQLIESIFLPGFSSAEEVSDTSGRGIGLDALKSLVLEMHGSINVDTKLNEYTLFKIEIPYIGKHLS